VSELTPENDSGEMESPTADSGTVSDPPTLTRRLSSWLDHYNLNFRTLNERPDAPVAESDTVYVLRDYFTTYLGSWEPGDEPASVPEWAREAYLVPEFLEAGADHHLFGAILDREGNLIKGAELQFWSDGLDKLADPNYDGYIRIQTKEESGWANNPLGPGSSYVPERDEIGPWCWAPAGAAEVAVGGGLPARHHVSTFAVWQEVDRADYEAALAAESGTTIPPLPPVEPPKEPVDPVEPPVDPIEPPVKPPVEPPTESTEPDEDEPDGTAPQLPAIEQRVSEWIEHMNIRLRTIAQRPDEVDQESDTVFLLKDVFTTINGSWEPGDAPYSIPQWARDAYLKPWGAPDYFDDAGADHHIFAAVIGTDGQLRRQFPIIFWSDGFDKLEDPTYAAYVHRETKERSGWINIPIGPDSNFVPERGESGPWCWAPVGPAEVIAGGGLPAKQHVSIFAVWQEVPRAALDESDEGDGAAGGEADDPGSGGASDNGEAGGEVIQPITPGLTDVRMSEWAQQMNLRMRTLEERGDSPVRNDGYVYVIKDIFTTRNGSWEMDDLPYSLPAWARDAYLKPWGAPDYFDDAGADHHLFAAVIGPDGQLLRNHQIFFWSDGFEKLGDPNYDGYIERRTKEHSGWINIPIGPSSAFWPDDGQSGPWCWAPAGAAEVIQGGGLPGKHHVSTFVVWQAVEQESVPGSGETGDAISTKDYSTYLPFVFGRNPSAMPQQAVPGGDIGEPAQLDMARLRGSAWLRLGFEGGQNSALAVYARQNQLGMPVTGVYRLDNLMIQGYLGGIVFHEQNKPETVTHVAW
jgi:hypothetical protein